MARLSRDWDSRKPGYDFIVVGSGYGGAISAARLTTAPLDQKPSVCLLERGKEWEVGSFPDTLTKYLDEIRDNDNPLGLYDMVNFKDISVIKGNGLGGTSLVNANVAIIPEEHVFQQSVWPRSMSLDTLRPFYQRALDVLKPSRHPRFEQLKKLDALRKRAAELGGSVDPLDITVTFENREDNGFGMRQPACTDCGDCVTGCNVGSKNTLYMNYLPLAARAGAEIFTQTKVEWIQKLVTGGWRVHGRHYRTRFSSSPFTLDAANVILAAGAVNSTEILLRSEMRGLRVSPRLGSGFSGNGDFFAISYNSDRFLQVLGFGNHPDSPGSATPPGPTITGAIRYNGGRPALNRFLVEDVAFPSPVVRAAQIAFAGLRGDDTDTGDEAEERRRVLQDLSQTNPYSPDGALNHTLLYLVTAFDDAKGSMEFEAPFWEPDGRLKIVWDDVGRQRIFSLVNEELRRHARSIGATFVENPIWTAFDLRRLITVHALGGCPLGEDYMHGAVDEFGRVFSGDGAVHDGLFVADGALVPSAVGVNPFMTISAVAERIAARKIEELQGNPYPVPKTAVSMAGVGTVGVASSRDDELDRLFQRCSSKGIDALVNSGEKRIDLAARLIHNDTKWKGFLPKGLLLGELAKRLFTGYDKKFWKEGGRYRGVTLYADGRIALNHALEEVTITERTNDLDPGKYILLRYTDPGFEDLFYDVMKVIHDDLVLYRGYTGKYPNGRRGWTAPLLRSYEFEQMTAADHRDLYSGGAPPLPADLEGDWRIDVVANANHATGIGWLRFDTKPDGRVEARCQFMGVMESLALPKSFKDHFRLGHYAGAESEIRKIDGALLLGKWIPEVPAELLQGLPADSLGIWQVEQANTGNRLAVYYMLTRAEAGDRPVNTLLQPFLERTLPQGVGMTFEEEMVGWYFPGAAATEPGRAGDLKIRERIPSDWSRPAGAVEIRFRVTMVVPDVNEFVEGTAHEARLKGTISFGEFGEARDVTFAVDERRSFFNYLIQNPETGEAEMRYHIEFGPAGGARYTFDGRKYMQKDENSGVRALAEILDDYTTLYVHVCEGERELGSGSMKFRTFEDLAATGSLLAFLRSFRITGTDDLLIQTQARLKFLAFTGQFITQEYDPAGILLRTDVAGAGTGGV